MTRQERVIFDCAVTIKPFYTLFAGFQGEFNEKESIESSISLTQQIITIVLCVAGTMLTRFLPFLIFSAKKPTPKFIQYLGKVLLSAIFGMLMVYCLKNVSIISGSYGLPELIAIVITVKLPF